MGPRICARARSSHAGARRHASSETIKLTPRLRTAAHGRRRASGSGFRHSTTSAMTRFDRVRFWAVAALWITVNVAFWTWWMHQTAHSTPWLFWIETVMLFYQTTFLPTVFWHFVGRMKRPVEVQADRGIRVAMVSPCVPASESLDVIREQLRALVDVDYPHD